MNFYELEQIFKLNNVSFDMVIEEVYKIVPKQIVEGIFVTGSLSEGHGTPCSDIDINVILNTPHQKSNLSKNIYLSGLRMDIEFLDYSYIYQLSNKLSSLSDDSYSINYTDKLLPTEVSDEFVFEFIGRIMNGTNLYSSEELSLIISKIKQCNFLCYLSHKQRILAENIYEDVVGFLEVGDHVSGYFQAYNLLLRALSYKLLKSGVYIDRIKWVPFHLKCHDHENYSFLEEFLSNVPSLDLLNSTLDKADELLMEV